MSPIVEKRFEYKGYPCVVLFQEMCYRCGYVGIPKGFPTDSRIENINCHGGITYTENYLYGQDDPVFLWIGFDCVHWRDGFDYEAGREYYKDDSGVLKRIDNWEEIHSHEPFERFAPKTLAFVENECKHIVDQLTSEVFQ